MQSRKQIAVFGSFLTNPQSAEFKMAEEVGFLLARAGLQVICGGHGGIADPLVAGVVRGGGDVLGVSLAKTKYPERNARMNPLIAEKVQIKSVSERLELFSRADGFIFFTGGIGTLSEFAFIWHSLQLEAVFDRPLVLLSTGWKRVLFQLRREQMIKYKYYRLVHSCDRPRDAVAVVSGNYAIKYDDPKDVFLKEAVVFDFDGTLVESPEELFIKSCENLGFFFNMPDVIESFRKVERASESSETDVTFYLKLLENLGMRPSSASEVAPYVWKRSMEMPELYGDAAGVVRHFKDHGFATGTVSSRPPLQVKGILSAHGLSGLIDTIRCRRQSPDSSERQSFCGVLESFGFGKDGMIYVGADCRTDQSAARSAGIDAIVLDRHLSHLPDDDPPVIRSLGELKHMIGHAAAG